MAIASIVRDECASVSEPILVEPQNNKQPLEFLKRSRGCFVFFYSLTIRFVSTPSFSISTVMTSPAFRYTCLSSG